VDEGGELVAEIIIQVENMSCNHCKMSIEKALRALDGVAAAEVNLAGKSVKVNYNPAMVDVTDIKKTITAAGYEVK
jgi:copper chaperone